MDVLLVCMPFGPVFSPSLGLSLLKAALHREGIPASVRYFSIGFAELIGQHFYYGVASRSRPPVIELPGEWVFAAALAETDPNADGYTDRILRDGDASAATLRQLRAARGRADEFLQWCVSEVVAVGPRVVGFTSVFQQHVASLALARRLKQALPDTFIVFGGANCEGVMGAETLRQFPFVDAVVSGEGDVVLPDLVRRVLASTPLDDLTGVRTRRSIHREFAFGMFPNTPVVTSLDDLPYPDFSDYMTQFGASRFDRDWQPSVPFETSRGCWWGAKHHCTFCGLNGATMAFRSKSPARALDELNEIVRRYPGLEVDVVDNILDMGYLKTVLPEVVRRRLEVTLFVETKANLRKDQVRLLRDAGASRIQPGIESLSDAVLALMRKGVSGLHNIQLLKWCKEFGVRPSWNLLWGFPGEPPEEYARMAALVPLLTHLPAPGTCSDIRMDRFSPNFVDAERLGLCDVRPLDSYRDIYALPDEAIRNLAYFFDFQYRDGREPWNYVKPLFRAVTAWQRVHRRSDLFSVDLDGRLLVWDFRPVATQALTVLTGVDRTLYTACDQIAAFASLAAVARSEQAMAEPETRRRLDQLVAGRLMIEEHDRYLALAIPVGEYQPAPAIAQRLFREIRSLERTPDKTTYQRPSGLAFRTEGRVPRPERGVVHFSAGTDGTVIVRSGFRGPA